MLISCVTLINRRWAMPGLSVLLFCFDHKNTLISYSTTLIERLISRWFYSYLLSWYRNIVNQYRLHFSNCLARLRDNFLSNRPFKQKFKSTIRVCWALQSLSNIFRVYRMSWWCTFNVTPAGCVVFIIHFLTLPPLDFLLTW